MRFALMNTRWPVCAHVLLFYGSKGTRRCQRGESPTRVRLANHRSRPTGLLSAYFLRPEKHTRSRQSPPHPTSKEKMSQLPNGKNRYSPYWIPVSSHRDGIDDRTNHLLPRHLSDVSLRPSPSTPNLALRRSISRGDPTPSSCLAS